MECWRIEPHTSALQVQIATLGTWHPIKLLQPLISRICFPLFKVDGTTVATEVDEFLTASIGAEGIEPPFAPYNGAVLSIRRYTRIFINPARLNHDVLLLRRLQSPYNTKQLAVDPTLSGCYAGCAHYTILRY